MHLFKEKSLSNLVKIYVRYSIKKYKVRYIPSCVKKLIPTVNLQDILIYNELYLKIYSG